MNEIAKIEGTRQDDPQVLFVVTSHVTAITFLAGQLRHLKTAGWKTHVVSAPGPGLVDFCRNEGAILHTVPMRRQPSPFADLRALAELVHTIRSVRPDVVIAGTPKAGLLAGVAGRLVRVRRRVYLVHGLRYEGYEGIRRRALIALEWISAQAATEIVAVSNSVRFGLTSARISQPHRVHVLADGSPNGVDTMRFSPCSSEVRREAREKLGIHGQAKVALFVGRLTNDKGLAELDALARALAPGEFLLIVGAAEPRDNTDRAYIDSLRSNRRTIIHGHAASVEPYYHAADVLVLPTRREGLPTVVLEAGSCGLPTVSYAVTGVVDAVVPGQTGILVAWGNHGAFVQETKRILREPEHGAELGRCARAMIVRTFDQHKVWEAWAKHLDDAPNW